MVKEHLGDLEICELTVFHEVLFAPLHQCRCVRVNVFCVGKIWNVDRRNLRYAEHWMHHPEQFFKKDISVGSDQQEVARMLEVCGDDLSVEDFCVERDCRSGANCVV